jgi:dTDP-4-amino-4,6-dideoxygalactose transaminase
MIGDREAFRSARGCLLNAERISDRTLSLPLSPKFTEDDMEDVIFAVRACWKTSPSEHTNEMKIANYHLLTM